MMTKLMTFLPLILLSSLLSANPHLAQKASLKAKVQGICKGWAITKFPSDKISCKSSGGFFVPDETCCLCQPGSKSVPLNSIECMKQNGRPISHENCCVKM